MKSLEDLPNGRIIVKDLATAISPVPGNPYARFDTSDESRKYCSKDLWENADQKFVIPQGAATTPQPLVECEVCGDDSYQDENNECGRCGTNIFDCPECGSEHHGEPEECSECGVKYNW